MKANIKDFDPKELETFIYELGEKPYRAKQISAWIFAKNARTFSEMTDLSLPFRDKLQESAEIRSTLNLIGEQKSVDGTKKYLFELNDGNKIESVLIPDKKRNTLCISSQVGCAMGCTFCLTARVGKIRNLSCSEIVDQYLAVNSLNDGCVTNIVYMGMGEPLDNLENTVKSLNIFTDSNFIGLSPRRITVSTSGLVHKIKELSEKVSVNLSVSLNAPSNAIRDEIMPVNKRFPISTLLKECKRFPILRRKFLTFEYVIIKDLNDSTANAHELAKLLKGINCKINLIPFNEAAPITYKTPQIETVLEFQKILNSYGLNVKIRRSRGSDILGACGQLAATYPLDNKTKKVVH
ncbi:MAG TPA: 23S rRNA (adenine(2503)-C(2))-methyltransferase RlmN [Thermodesulfobacteriota bacterium]|nr:23S rRNA (adenine(2503)-C(2))-methyltransferase RlmN [Thermodesulfobacteriota bacterium]